MDSYIDEQGRKVFTREYHLKRGYCCESGCRHCPYGFMKDFDPNIPMELQCAPEIPEEERLHKDYED